MSSPTAAIDQNDSCPECGENPQRHGNGQFRVWHSPTCHMGGFVDPTPVDPEDPDGYWTHPSWALARANVLGATPGQPMFDSDILHSRFVRLTITRARRKRDLHRDHYHGDTSPLIEIDMSQAQWGALVSSFGDGTGVPVTLSRFDGDTTSTVPYEPRLAESIDEVRRASTDGVEPIADAYEEVMAAFETGGRKALRDALTDLGHRIDNAPKNMTYAAQTLVGHAENVVTKARADIEAAVLDAARHHGVDVGSLGAGWDSGPAALATPNVDEQEVIR